MDPRSSARRAVLAAAAVCTVIGGCSKDEPADLFPPGQRTGDPAIDAVLGPLDRAEQATSTVTYRIVRRLGGLASSATVSREGDQRVIDFGNVVFRRGAKGEQTCRGEACSAGWDQTAISDRGVSATFWGPAAARRLRRDAAAKVVPATARTTTVAGQPATCVAVPLGPGTAEYCVFADGMIAQIVEGDVFVDAERVG